MGKRTRRRVTIAGDVHFPWASDAALQAFYKRLHVFQPEVVVQIGDIYDMFSMARFPGTKSIYTPQQELALARRDAEKFWLTVKEACPKARRVQLWGNHDDRPVKKALAHAPELEHFVKEGMHKLMHFPGVITAPDSREMYMVDDVGYHHGYLLQPGAHARSFNHNIVVGHTHFGCVIPVMTEHGQFWELNAGFLADRFAKPLSYTAQRKFSKWTRGFGEVDDVGPRFIPVQEKRR